MRHRRHRTREAAPVRRPPNPCTSGLWLGLMPHSPPRAIHRARPHRSARRAAHLLSGFWRITGRQGPGPGHSLPGLPLVRRRFRRTPADANIPAGLPFIDPCLAPPVVGRGDWGMGGADVSPDRVPALRLGSSLRGQQAYLDVIRSRQVPRSA
jgi:hypothetical protein